MADVESYRSVSMRGKVFTGEFGGTLPVACTAGLKPRALLTSVALSSREGVCDVVEVTAQGGGGSMGKVGGCDSFALRMTSCVGALWGVSIGSSPHCSPPLSVLSTSCSCVMMVPVILPGWTERDAEVVMAVGAVISSMSARVMTSGGVAVAFCTSAT